MGHRPAGGSTLVFGEPSISRRFRFAVTGVRELTFVFVAGFAAWVFLHHDILYMRASGPFQPVSLGAYALSTAVMYLFIRLTSLIATLRVPQSPVREGTCPECGRPLADVTHQVGHRTHKDSIPMALPRLVATPAPTIRAQTRSRRHVGLVTIETPMAEISSGIPGDYENEPRRPATPVGQPPQGTAPRPLKQPWRPFG